MFPNTNFGNFFHPFFQGPNNILGRQSVGKPCNQKVPIMMAPPSPRLSNHSSNQHHHMNHQQSHLPTLLPELMGSPRNMMAGQSPHHLYMDSYGFYPNSPMNINQVMAMHGNQYVMENSPYCFLTEDERNCGRWTEKEHNQFMNGLKLHGKSWKKIANLIPSRSVVQIRTHAQKYFKKLEKKDSSLTPEIKDDQISLQLKRKIEDSVDSAIAEGHSVNDCENDELDDNNNVLQQEHGFKEKRVRKNRNSLASNGCFDLSKLCESSPTGVHDTEFFGVLGEIDSIDPESKLGDIDLDWSAEFMNMDLEDLSIEPLDILN